jgi:hypothetical protein
MSKAWTVAALAGALLWGACSKEQAPAPAPVPKPAPVKVEAPAEPAPTSAPEASKPEPEPEAEAPVEDNGPPPEFKVGQSRSEVMKLFGKCAERRAFEPPGPGRLYVEVYQPKLEEACKKRLGERHFMIVGGKLEKIIPGLIPPEPPRTETEPPPPEGI